MNTILEALRELSSLEESAKTDFTDKFGQDTLNKFDKAKDRLKNKGYSVDYGQYLKNSKEEVEDLILSLYDKEKDAQKRRVLQGKDKEIRGEYEFLGEEGGYKIYHPLDVYSSMDLGVNTGWCTTGRYGHYGHPEFTPSEEEAQKHWDEYAREGIQLYYFLNPETMYGEYAIAVHPKVITLDDLVSFEISPNCRVERINFELFDDKDELDYSKFKDLPTDKIPGLVLDCINDFENPGWFIKGNVLKGYSGKEKSITIPNNVTSIGEYAFYKCSELTSVTIPESVTSIGEGAFYGCKGLTSVSISSKATSIGNGAFWDCSGLTSISIPDGVTSIGVYMFYGCSGLTSITIPNSVTAIWSSAFKNCIKLNKVYIKGKLTKIASNAFDDCEQLKEIYFNQTQEDFLNIPDGRDLIFNISMYPVKLIFTDKTMNWDLKD